MMDEGAHDYGWAEAQRAMARQATIPTLDELKANTDMVTTESGALVPAVLAARGDAGWLDDADRDSGQAAKLGVLVAKLDSMACVWLSGSADQSVSLALADDMANTWQAIRKITQGNQP